MCGVYPILCHAARWDAPTFGIAEIMMVSLRVVVSLKRIAYTRFMPI